MLKIIAAANFFLIPINKQIREREKTKTKRQLVDKVVFVVVAKLLVITLTFSVFFVISAAKQVGAAPTSFREHEKALRGNNNINKTKKKQHV